MGDRERLRTTFDQAAELYQDARSEYPEELFDRMIEVAGLGPGDRIPEIGVGPGKATLPLARRSSRSGRLRIGCRACCSCRFWRRRQANRLHPDFRPVDQIAEVERLLSLGARRVDVGQLDASWVVLADPEGNEFGILGGRVRPDSSEPAEPTGNG